LLDAIHFDAATDRLWFVGDLINRGPESLRTLRKVKALGAAAMVVLGNHDLHLLAASIGVRKPSPSDTLSEILNAPDAAELLEWVRQRQLAHREVVACIHPNGEDLVDHLLVHAGVLPDWTAEALMQRAAEVETALRGSDWQAFLAHLFGNNPERWQDDLQGDDRLRVIVNACTRLRFCTPLGQMEFATKEGADGAPDGFMPWFEIAQRRTQSQTVVFGHWSTLGLITRPNLLALDTGCVWGGRLTAVRLEDRALFQVQCPQARRPG
jgi:bis(5'-nucleosyl)-tetraphosphatase (symmetrical)